jgi:hypothetical protein
MRTGAQGEYTWFESDSLDLHGLLTDVPEAVLGRPLAIASFDSGPLVPTAEEVAAGWEHRNGVTYVPHAADVSVLPYEHYDEWYVLDALADLGPIDPFVNYSGFGVSDPDRRYRAPDVGWDLVGRQCFADAERARQTRFWAQVTRIRPVSCILNGDVFVVVTRDASLIGLLKNWFAQNGA